MQFLLESFRALWSSLRIFYILVPIQIFVSFFSEKEQQIHSTPCCSYWIPTYATAQLLFIYLGMYLFHIGWGTIHQYPLMEKINIRYLKKEWICGARKIDIGCKSPFVLWQDSNYFQNNEPCLNGGLPRIVNGLVPRGSRQFQRNDHRHGPIVISQSLLGFDPWRPCEMYDLQNKNKQKFSIFWIYIIICWWYLC